MGNQEMLRTKILTVRGREVSIADMLDGMGAMGASDLFLKTGTEVRFKVSGRVATFESDRVSRDAMAHVVSCFLNEDEKARLRTSMVADVVHATEHARYRIHIAYGQTGLYAAIRIIASDILPLDGLGLPDVTVSRLQEMTRGLLLVCGSTDAGKTVTCTSLLDYHNQYQEMAILTLEDPVEYILEDKSSLVLQREVGVHVPSFFDGIRSALRENLDVIFVGELRDTETMEQVLRAVEMGHLVITTIHAEDALSALTRFIGTFVQPDQPRIRQALASTLTGVLYQRLLPKVGGGRVPCIETMWANRAVRSILRAGDVGKLASYVGRATGGHVYNEQLRVLRQANLIDAATLEAETQRLSLGI